MLLILDGLVPPLNSSFDLLHLLPKRNESLLDRKIGRRRQSLEVSSLLLDRVPLPREILDLINLDRDVSLGGSEFLAKSFDGDLSGGVLLLNDDELGLGSLELLDEIGAAGLESEKGGLGRVEM